MPIYITRSIPAIVVKQWLQMWDEVSYSSDQRRRKPEPHFYMFSISAAKLRALSGVSRRSVDGNMPRIADIGIQRRLDEKRVAEIKEYVKYGFPWSDLNKKLKKSPDYNDLKKPGWLPTAIVVNILRPEDNRRNHSVHDDDLMCIEELEECGLAQVHLPHHIDDPEWKCKALPPIEIIDGQHRLYAFDSDDIGKDYYLPVIAFYGLDVSWQAYLFWTINIRPKHINPSLAFDMYPLLRAEEWLEKTDNYSTYRETRAQELVEWLWSTPESPWFQRINMLGEKGNRSVSQAAWVKTMTDSFLKSSNRPVSGLFSGKPAQIMETLPWSRAQQAAFLVLLWSEMKQSVKSYWEDKWNECVQAELEFDTDSNDYVAAFEGGHTLLNADVGVRAVMRVANIICVIACTHFNVPFGNWICSEYDDDENEVLVCLGNLRNEHEISMLVREIAEGLSSYDWRSYTHPSLDGSEKTLKLVFRGSGGYSELSRQLMSHLCEHGNGLALKAARLSIDTESGKSNA